MSLLWIAVLALSASPSEGVAPVDSVTPSQSRSAEPLASPRTGRELEEAARAALRHWAGVSDKQADTAAREFVVLYKELQQDTRLARSQREEVRVKVRSRLSLLAQQIAKRNSQETRVSKSEAKSVRVGQDTKVLAQAGAGFGMGGAGPAAQGGGGVANDDAGEDLVALIQQTIAPKTWEANGGPGTISYWRTQRAIVARTTQDVHEEISDVLEQLNRAGH